MKVLAAAALVLALASPALAQRSAPKEFERGAKHYANGEFARAAAAFRVAFELDDATDYLFAWAQAERLAGNCADAVGLYRQLLERGVSDAQEALIREASSLCEGEATDVTDEAPDVSAETSPPVAAQTAPELVADPDPSIQGRRDDARASRIGPVALGAVGLLGLGLGGALYVSGRSAAGAEAETSGQHLDNIARAKSRQRNAAVSATLGAGLVVGAAIWWMLQEDGDDDQSVAAWIDDDRAGGGLMVWGRF